MNKKKLKKTFFFAVCIIILGLFYFLVSGELAKQGLLNVKNSTFSQQADSQCRVFSGEIMLPAGSYWQIASAKEGTNISELYLVPAAPIIDEQMGSRLTAVMEKKQTQKGRYLVQQLLWPCTEFAKKNNGIGPSSINELDAKRHQYMLKNLNRSPYDQMAGGEITGPFVFLVPRVKFRFEENKRYPRAKNRDVLAYELRPYVDDGKHWVLYTDGSCQRQPVDKKLVKKYDQVIRPVKVKKRATGKEDITKRSYSIAAVCKENPRKPVLITLEDAYSGKTLTAKWDLRKALGAEKSKPVDLKSKRLAAWLPYAIMSRSPVLSTWMSAIDKGIAKNLISPSGRRQPENLSAFDILGGRAAVRETLQLQVLNPPPGEAAKDKEYTIDVESIEGVKVKSHPFAEMLKNSGNKGGTLPLAELAPHDHFFVYMANPGDILGFLDQGCGFLDRIGSNFTGNSVDYGLDRKYPESLGFNRELLQAVLKLGVIKDCALIFPDLFFIDGTDITVISRLTKAGAVKTLLKLMGIRDFSQEKIISRKLKNGAAVFWCLWENLFVISTAERELKKVLELKSGGGKGSLGKSDEFRYMLTQLPVKKSTWSYAYLSDPFIRRLVSPAVKIAQLRRIKARAEMEYLTACALLAQLDGMKSPFSIKKLADYGYIPERYIERSATAAARPNHTNSSPLKKPYKKNKVFTHNSIETDYYFDSNHILHSQTFGRLANMKSLSEVPIERVSEREKKAYERYVRRYSSYWQQYFDPIALRLDEAAAGFLEAEVFILPLINNSVYNSLKDTLKSEQDDTELKIPRLSAEPVVMLSLNLREEAWQGIVKAGYSLLSRYIPIHPAIFEDFGPGLHLAVHDADPVVALGSGDLLGVFNANILGAAPGGMLSLPVILSTLTRPCTLIIETQNPERTLSFLRRTVPALRMDKQWDELQVRVHQVADRDQWVFSFNLAGIIKLRFGVELQNEFLLIRNIPWSHDEKITALDRTALRSAALTTYPDACDLQLPGLFEAAQDRSLFEAFQGVGRLYPLVLSGYAALDEAAQRHAALFGFAPKHPADGRFLWENFHIKSSIYGSVFNQRQPAYQKGDTKFGLLEGLHYLSVSMQFEDAGLRTKFRWLHGMEDQ